MTALPGVSFRPALSGSPLADTGIVAKRILPVTRCAHGGARRSLTWGSLYIHLLRLILGRDGTGPIRSAGGGYVLDADPERLDMTRFTRLVSRARRALRDLVTGMDLPAGLTDETWTLLHYNRPMDAWAGGGTTPLPPATAIWCATCSPGR